MERVVVVGTPEPLPERFDRARWPLHVTVVSNFVVDDRAPAEVASIVRDVATLYPRFTVNLGPLALFGPARDLPVLLAEHAFLHVLHTKIAAAISELPAFRPDSAEFWGPGYRPHATITSYSTPPPSRQTSITNLAVAVLGEAQVRTLMTCELSADGSGS